MKNTKFEEYPTVFRAFFLSCLSIFGSISRSEGRLKDDDSMGVPADIEMHRRLSDFLSTVLFKPVFSEESEHAWPPDFDTFWLIDPFDGSRNQSIGLPMLCGSMVSLFKRGQPIFGCIFVPTEERDNGDGFYYALKGKGAWRWRRDGPEMISLSEETDLSRAMLIVEGPSRKVAARDDVRRLQKVAASRENLCCALSFTRLAAGFVDVVVSAENKPTDTLHGVLFTREAGGVVTDFDGRLPRYTNCSDLIYTSRQLHPEVLRILREPRNIA